MAVRKNAIGPAGVPLWHARRGRRCDLYQAWGNLYQAWAAATAAMRRRNASATTPRPINPTMPGSGTEVPPDVEELVMLPTVSPSAAQPGHDGDNHSAHKLIDEPRNSSMGW